MAVNNSTIMARAWLEGTNDYQQRITDPTQGGIAATIRDLFDPMNKMYYNQFQDYLVQRIAKTVAHGRVFEQPLARFKKEKIDYGQTIQNVAFEWLAAHAYTDDDETLLKMERPRGRAWYVSQNRRDRYDLSITRQELYAATDSEYGLNNLINKMLELPTNSDNYDEMQIMINLLAVYETQYGFFKRQLTAAPNDEESGKEFLTRVMADTGYMTGFPSTTYNAMELGGNIPVFVPMDDLILIVTPETNAAIKVNTYAGLFNVEEARAQARIVQVPFIPIPGAVALLTSKDIFDCHDTLYETDTFWNPKTLTNNYYLHHWGIYGVNPYVPCVLYTTGEGTTVPEIQQSVTSLSLTSPEGTNVVLGGEYPLQLDLQGSITDDNNANHGGAIQVRPDAATFSITLEPTEGSENSALNSRTRIDDQGVLHIQKSGLSTGDKITVNAASTYWDPTGSNSRQTASLELTVA